eukprot:4454479-Pyramimonas_sp.AAC.1
MAPMLRRTSVASSRAGAELEPSWSRPGAELEPTWRPTDPSGEPQAGFPNEHPREEQEEGKGPGPPFTVWELRSTMFFITFGPWRRPDQALGPSRKDSKCLQRRSRRSGPDLQGPPV